MILGKTLTYTDMLIAFIGLRKKKDYFGADGMESRLWQRFQQMSVEECRALAPNVLEINKEIVDSTTY